MLGLGLCAAWVLGCGPEAETTAVAEPSRLVVIGVDSLSWTLADPLLAEGDLPHLAALGARGLAYERLDQLTVELLLGVR